MAVPLAVVGSATGPYDDPKAWALPILVAATGLAWVLGARAGGPLPAGPADRADRALLAIVLAFVAWQFVTTATSIAPVLSVLGNFGRGMGLLVTVSAALLFFLAHAECATRERLLRLVDAALLGSVPVCLIGLGQACGFDPMPRSWDPSVATLPVRSTFGQHIFLGSYLVLLIPVAAARLDMAWRAWRAGEPERQARPSLATVLLAGLWIAGALALVALASRWPALWWWLAPWGVAGAVALGLERRSPPAAIPVDVAALAALLGAQALVLVVSRGRGPLLGLMLGAAVAGFALAARRRARRSMVAGAVVAIVLVVGLVMLNVPGSPLAPLARTHLLDRLAQLSETRPGSPVWFRLQIWDGIVGGFRDQLRGEAVIPGTSPLARSILGYGLETELISLNPLALRSIGSMTSKRSRLSLTYLVDRAHNALLEQLATTGLVGAALWIALIAAVMTVGIRRIRAASTDEDGAVLRIGCLGALIAHVAEGQVGITTPMPLALFWMVSAWLTLPASEAPRALARVRRGPWWTAGVVGVLLLGAALAWGSTRWLLGSTAYAEGVVVSLSGALPIAYPAFQRSRELMPWLPLPAEAVAQAALRLTAGERDPVTRARLLLDAEEALAELRRHALPGATDWSLAGQIAFAQARAGDRARLPASIAAFATATRLAPPNAQLMAQWAWALLESGDAPRAREVAEQALAVPPGPRSWLAWAVLARAAADLGDRAKSERAAARARRFAPPEARRVLDTLLP